MLSDSQVFDETHLPPRLLHREGVVDEVLRAWGPTTVGERARNVMIHGPSGVGKTVLARYCLEELDDEADVHHAYVRTLGESTAGILRATLRDLPGPDPAMNTPESDLALALYERVDRPCIVVLDEADGLPTTDGLDKLLDVDGLSVVVVCHDPEEFLARMDLSVGRTFSPLQIRLDRYGVDELADILEARADVGLRSGVVKREQLRTIADEVAGVARFGIQALREAALAAVDHGHDTIQDVDVANSFARARRRVREANLASLPFHHHVLYELVREYGALEPDELHCKYESVVDQAYRGSDRTPIGERDRRRKLRKLQQYDLVAIEGDETTRDRVYRVVDETIVAPLNIDLG